MPGIVADEIHEEGVVRELNGNGNLIPFKENLVANKSTNSPSSPKSPQIKIGYAVDEAVDTSIDHLYDNVCEMQSSDHSPSRRSFGSEGEESRIDSELRHLVGGEMREVEIMEEEEGVQKAEDNDCRSDSGSKKESLSAGKKSGKFSTKSLSPTNSKKVSHLQLESDATSGPNSRSPQEKPPLDKRNDKSSRKPTGGGISTKKQRNVPMKGMKSHNGTEDPSESGLENPDLGPFLLKQARDLISSGDNPRKALEFALRAAKSFEKCANGKPSLDVVMCLHVTAAIYCNLGQYSEAIPVLEHSIEIPVIEDGQDQALAKFAGHMQLGDTYAMLGQFENSIMCYTMGLEVQRQVLGDADPRVGETCRYLAEAHIQTLQFDEAEKLCRMALDIHRENNSPASVEEAADRRLMGLICETKGDHEAALEHLVLASMAMVANGQEKEVAAVDLSIGDAYLSLSRYDEAIFAYQKALTAFKSTKGENHPTISSVFVRLADLYNKTGQLRESKSYCENALRIYEKPSPGIPPEEIASGLTDVSAIYESMNELEQALKLLQKALKIYNDAPGQQNTIAGIEAQMGVMYYVLGNYSESYTSFKNAILKLRASGEKKSAFFGIALNQMGLTCVQRYAIKEAAELFEEARNVLEQEYGPYHPDTLGVYSNLAGTYDAIGRLDDAIEILEYVVGMREEKLGTANPDVDDEKKRLAELLKEAGRVGNRRGRSLENLLDANPPTINGDGIKFQLEDAIEKEDFQEAAKLKTAIAEATSKDSIAEIMSELKDAIDEERYHDASRLCKSTGSGLVGWWVGYSKDSDDPFGRLIRVSPGVGRFVGKSFSPRQLVTASPGTPLFEIFVVKDGDETYTMQVVFLKRTKGSTTKSTSSSTSKPTKGPSGDIENASVVDVEVNEDKSEKGNEKSINFEGATEEGMRSVINFLKDKIPELKVKVMKVNISEEVIEDNDSVKKLLEEEDEKSMSSENSEDEASNLDDIQPDQVSLGGGSDAMEDGKSLDMMKLFIGGVLHNKEESSSKDEYVRVPGEIENMERDSFVLHVPVGRQDRDTDKSILFDVKVAALAAQGASELMPPDVAKAFFGADKVSPKVSRDVREIVKLAVSQAQKKEKLFEYTSFSRITTSKGVLDPFDGLYVGAFGPYGTEVVQLRRKYGNWNGVSDTEESSNVEFFEYVEAVKLTGDLKVPAGQVTFRIKIGQGNRLSNRGMYPDELGVVASYKGQGRIAEFGFKNPKWVEGELLQLNGKGMGPYVKGADLGFLYVVPEQSFLVLFSRLKLPE